MKDIFQMWADHFCPDTCDQIVELALGLHAPRRAEVGSAPRVDEAYRVSDVRWLDRDVKQADGLPAWTTLFGHLDHYMRWANHTAFGLDVNFLQDLQFTTYYETRKDHFNWHRDSFWVNPHETGQRKLSAIIQLSDPADYDGGVLELDVDSPPDPAALRRRGTLIVMPAFVWHRVTPVTRGTRHSLVAWMAGPPWR